MEPLATAADMAARNIAPDRYTTVALAAASAAVREAAGVPISSVTATVVVPGTYGAYLELPSPLIAATNVSIDGVGAGTFQVRSTCLYRSGGWGGPSSQVQATITTGATVPEDIKQLVCELAVLTTASDPLDPRVASESIDGAFTSYRNDVTSSSIELPEATKRSLRARFSGSPVTGVR